VTDPPTPISPISNAVIDAAGLTFVVGNARRSGPAGAMSYMFELADSNAFTSQVGAWKASEQPGQTSVSAGITLVSGKQYFWRVYAFDPTHNGPWSATQVFQTAAGSSPGPPPPGGGGNWEACSAYTGDKPALVACVHGAVNPAHTADGAFEVTKRVAWLLRGEGAGLLIKNGGENIVSWKGYSFSASRILYSDLHLYKCLSDVPTTNGPTWQDEGIDATLSGRYVPAIDPR